MQIKLFILLNLTLHLHKKVSHGRKAKGEGHNGLVFWLTFIYKISEHCESTWQIVNDSKILLSKQELHCRTSFLN